MKTVIYLIRHSLKFDNERIIKCNSMQSDLIKNEKIVLSVKGEEKAKKLSKLEELKNINKVYASNCR